ncbi:hypothetical protein ACJMK2_008620 [Sinanodonta woodiana]|uniref:Dynamin-type G domain-containing protein n=1 Tax=Sinanodonta woodiana TaxID=1069815 RepID=A0ABD3VMY4_SINWO
MSGYMTRMEEKAPQMGQGDAGSSGQRSLGNGRQSPSSPLKLFGQAKKTANEIFRHIADYIVDVDSFVQEICQVGYIEGIDFQDTIKGFKDKVTGIMEVLGRDHMKVVFFGRTSNGKSTVINAMLREKILPSGIGHTTNCFLQVEGGTDSQEAFLLTEDQPDEQKSIQSIKQLAHALSSVKLESNSLIRIVWPKEKCRLLKEDVVFVDSPGIDVTPDLDVWIDKFCLDADVFVLVSNAESTLMQTEKNFFHKVNERLSKPNLFILQNRWDTSVYEEDVEAVKQQHLERNLEFLVDELGVTDSKEGYERVFFVSAREALVSRLNQDKGTPTPTGTLQEGFQARLFEFANFERKFEECISKSAVKTKFEQHTQRGKKVTGDLKALMDKTFTLCLEQLRNKEWERQEKADELDYKQKQLSLLTVEVKDKIKSMVEDVERKVSSALNEEIRRLSLVVDEFDQPFHPDPALLTRYKKELHEHVDIGLGRNVQNKCSAVLKSGVEVTQREMTERLSALLPEETRQLVINSVPKHDFEIAYRLDCRSLCSDFQEDIEFHFSFSITNLMQRFLGRKGTRKLLLGYSDTVPRPLAMTPQTPVSEQYHAPVTHDSDVVATILTVFASLTSRTTVGSLVVGGLVAKAAGVKVIGVCLMAYFSLYVYERLTWTNKAKERAFKRQYVDYAGSKLRLIVDLTSSNCSHQVQQELTSTFARLCHHVDISGERLAEEIKQLDKEISQLHEVKTKAKVFRNKADWLDKELSSFTEQYLKETVL